jgi:predicted RND superfamily exporter protein
MLRHAVKPEDALRRLTGVLLGLGPLKMELTETGRMQRSAAIDSLRRRVRSELGFEIDVIEQWANADSAGGSSAGQAEAHADEGFAEAGFEDEEFAEEVIEEDLADEGAEFAPGNAGFVDETIEAPTEDIVPNAPPATVPTWPGLRAFDFEVAWPGMHVQPASIEAVRKLALKLKGPLTSQAERHLIFRDCFVQAGSPVALSVVFSEAGAADDVAAIDEIRRIAAEVGIAPHDLSIGGNLVTGTALNQAVTKLARNGEASWWQMHQRSPLWLACIVTAGIALVMLRSLRLTVIVLVVAFYATLVTIALMPLTGGSLNIVLAAMPVLVMALTTSAAIHLVNYWKHAAHHDMRTAVADAAEMARQPCIVASVTTAVALASLMTSPLEPVRDFGLYAVIGCLLSLVVVLYGLPALLAFWPSPAPQDVEINGAGWKKLGHWIADHRKSVTGVSFLLLALGLYGMKGFRTETNVIHYFRGDSRIVQDNRFIAAHLAGPMPLDVIVRFDATAQANLNFLQRMEVVRHVQDRVRRHHHITGTLSLADFQPKYRPLSERATPGEAAAFNERIRSLERQIKGADEGVASAFVATPRGSSPFHATGDELWRITAQAALLSDADSARLLADLDDLAHSALVPHVGTHHVVAGAGPLFMRSQSAVLGSLVRCFAVASVLIAGMMVFQTRNLAAGVLITLPTLLPITIMFGIAAWAGVAVDIGVMLTAAIGLALALDGTLHLSTWFRIGLENGLSRRDAAAEALSHRGPAMWQASTALSFGLLMLCSTELQLVARFAWLSGTMILAVLASQVFLMPAMLAGKLGMLIERTVRRRTQRQPTRQRRPAVEVDAASDGHPARPHITPQLRPRSRVRLD